MTLINYQRAERKFMKKSAKMMGPDQNSRKQMSRARPTPLHLAKGTELKRKFGHFMFLYLQCSYQNIVAVINNPIVFTLSNS